MQQADRWRIRWGIITGLALGALLLALLALYRFYWRPIASAPLTPALPSPTAISIAPYPIAIRLDATTHRAFILSRGPLDPQERPLGPGVVTALDLETTQVLYTATVGLDPVDIAIDPPTDRLFIANRGPTNAQGNLMGPGTVTLLTATRGIVIGDLPVKGTPSALAPIAGAGLALVTLQDPPPHPGHVALLDSRAGTLIGEIPVGVYPAALLVQGNRAWVANFLSNTLSELDLDQRQVVRTLPLGPEPGTLAHLAWDAPTGFLFALAYPPRMTGGGPPDGTLWRIDPTQGEIQEGRPVPDPTALGIDSAHHLILVAGMASEEGRLLAFDTRTGTLIWEAPVGRVPWAIGIDEAREEIFVISRDDASLNVLGVDGRLHCTRPVGRRPVALALDPHTHRVLVADAEDHRLWLLAPSCQGR
jgi:DNA-binding beta-propeller fold protein YncE